MKNFVLLLSVLTSISSFANTDSGYVKSEKNAMITKELAARLSPGTYTGLTDDNRKCSVEIGNYEITMKTEDFQKDHDIDCLSSDTKNIACFEFSDATYLPQRSLFSSGDIFSTKVYQQTAENFRFMAKRNLGGDGKYDVTISNSASNKSVKIIENQADGEMVRSLKCNF